ncbi:MAG: hypothetical protein IJ518_03590 [Clostridia bacterium]|nr:hypothetical protein [Clostridia bacterium]
MKRSRLARLLCLLMVLTVLCTAFGACKAQEGCGRVMTEGKIKNTYAYRKDAATAISLEQAEDRVGLTAGNHRVEFVRNSKGEYVMTTYIKKGGEWTPFYNSGEALIQGTAFGAHPTKAEVVEDTAAYKAVKLSGTHPSAKVKNYTFDILVEAYEGNPLIHFVITNHLKSKLTLTTGEPRIMLWRNSAATDLVYTNQEVPTYQTVDDTSRWCSGFPASYTYTDGMASAFYLDVTNMTWFSNSGLRRFADAQVRTTQENGRVGTGMDLRNDSKGDTIAAGDMIVEFYLYGEEVTETPTKQEGLNTAVEVFANCLSSTAVSPKNYLDCQVDYGYYMDKIVEGLMAENVSYQWQDLPDGVWSDGPLFTDYTINKIVQRQGYVPGSDWRKTNNATTFFGDWNCNNNTILPLVLYNRLNEDEKVDSYLDAAKPGLLTYFDRMASMFRSFTGQSGSGLEFTFQNYLMQQGTLWASQFTPVEEFDPAYGGKFIQAAYGMQTLAQNVNYKQPQLIDVGRMGAASSIDETHLGVTWEVWSGGFYAYNMMLAYDVTGNEMYLNEAKKQLETLFGGLEYYANSLKQKLLNNTYEYAINEVSSAPWGIAAAQWIYRVTGEEKYLQYSEDIRNITLRMMTWYESAVADDPKDQAIKGQSFFSAFSNTWTTCPWESIQTYLPMVMELKNTDVQASQVLLKAFNLFRINCFSFSGASWDPSVIDSADVYQSMVTAYFMPEDYYCLETPTMPGNNGANNYMTNTLMYAWMMYEAYAEADSADIMVINVDVCDEALEMAEGVKRHFVVFNPLATTEKTKVQFKDLDKDAKYTLTILDEQGNQLSKETLTGKSLMNGYSVELDSMTYVHAVVEADEATMKTFTAAKEAQHKLMQAYAALQTAGEYADVSTLSQQKTKFLEAKALYQKGDYAACIAAVDAFYGTIPTFD